MSTVSAAKVILEADSTLLATATGGIYDFDETGRLGINRTNAATSGAFDSNKIIKPCVLLNLRSSNPDYMLADDANQYVSVREMVEIWLFENNGYSNIETMRLRIYALLHTKQLSGTFTIRWAGDFQRMHDMNLDANVLRCDYLAITKRSV